MQPYGIVEASSNLSWGRNRRRSWISSILCLGMVTISPLLVLLPGVAFEKFDGSLVAALSAMYYEGLNQYVPLVGFDTMIGYGAWILLQAILYAILPGKGTGQMTPAGNLLQYNINGLLAWQLTIFLALVAITLGILDPNIIADNWGALVMAANTYGLFVTGFAYAKAHLAPSHAKDRKFSGSAMYDFYMGIELSPRIGKNWDWKLFQVGRPGMIAWTLIDISYTALQYRTYGCVTNSMIIVDILHAIYVVDFFINEDWYIRTIDICHDHFGFYLGWAPAAWLPTIYTLQVQYLARNPVQLSFLNSALIFSVGIGSYLLFRSANHQKNLVRRTKGDCTIWRKKPRFITAKFRTSDGNIHESLLLVSGE